LSRQIRDLEYEVGVPLLSRSAHGVELTAAGRAFLDHARLALTQAEAAAEAARRAAQPAKPVFAMGFTTGQEVDWLPRATSLLRGELANIDIRVSSDHSATLANELVQGKLDIAFLRAEQIPDIEIRVIAKEPLEDGPVGLDLLLLLKKSLLHKKNSLLVRAGNCATSDCGTGLFILQPSHRAPKTANFPVIFPVRREFAWRRVRSALPFQPSSPAVGATGAQIRRKARQSRPFAIPWVVSTLPFWQTAGRIRQKSPATTPNFPVFGRLAAETEFDCATAWRRRRAKCASRTTKSEAASVLR
jgi:hypothetical protein